MDKKSSIRFPASSFDNRKSKTCTEPFESAVQDKLRRSIENLKWAGVVVILVLILGCVGMAQAQQPTKVPRIGYITAASRSTIPARIEAFRQGMRELGYVEDKNIVIEWRFGERKEDRYLRSPPNLCASR